MTCSIEDCSQPIRAKGLCNKHYLRQQRNGDPRQIRVIRDDAVWRFWSHVRFTETCWLWTLPLHRTGYAYFRVSGTKVLAHRWAYEFCVGTVPAGLNLDHLCRTRHCVRPDHMDAVEPSENVARGIGPTAENGRKTACDHGHEFTPENTYQRPGHPNRYCRECMRSRSREYMRRKRTHQRAPKSSVKA